MKNRKVSRKLIAIFAVVAMLSTFLAIHVAADEVNAPASGYAAVGIVDAEAHKAEVLLGTGEQGTVRFTGDAPAAGAVYSYTRSALNVYTFTVPNANHGYSNQLADAGWPFWSEKSGWIWNANIQYYYPGTNPIFFRFGENQWAITTLGNFEGAGGASHMFGYALDAVDNGGNFYPGAFVFGGYGEGGVIDNTGFNVMVPSLTATNNLSAFTNDLHEVPLEAGYAAIGAIDSENSLVEILKGTGEQGYVSFTGTAPVTGGVYRYARNEDNVYTFTEPTANHGNSKVHDASAAAWQMWMSEDYGCYMWDGALNHYWPTSTTPVFVRTGSDAWIITTSACFTNGASVMAYQLDTVARGGTNYFDVGAVVFGGLNADGTIDTTGFDQLKLPETTADLSALTTALHPVDPPEKDPDQDPDPVPSEPEENVQYTPSGNVVESGYAAVGIVDGENSKAEVLLGNGAHGTVYFAGEAPKSGAVYGYQRHSNNVFVFTEKTGNFGNSNQLAAGQAWNLWFEPMGWAWDANQPNDIFHVPTPTPIFLRYGDNQWALTTIEKVSQNSGAYWAYGYALDTEHMPDLDAQNNLTNFRTGALVMGNMNADGTIDTTGFTDLFGSAGANVDLSSFTSDLYSAPAQTGEDAAFVAAIVALLFSAGAIGFVVKKKNF